MRTWIHVSEATRNKAATTTVSLDGSKHRRHHRIVEPLELVPRDARFYNDIPHAGMPLALAEFALDSGQ